MSTYMTESIKQDWGGSLLRTVVNSTSVIKTCHVDQIIYPALPGSLLPEKVWFLVEGLGEWVPVVMFWKWESQSCSLAVGVTLDEHARGMHGLAWEMLSFNWVLNTANKVRVCAPERRFRTTAILWARERWNGGTCMCSVNGNASLHAFLCLSFAK